MDNIFVCTNNNIKQRVRSYLNNNPYNYPDISTWDVSQVTDMSHLFYDDLVASSYFNNFNEDLNSWDVSNVTNMAHAFYGCSKYNKSLDRWNVANVVNMEFMLAGCSELNQSFDNWNVSNVVNMTGMFKGCSNLNSPLNNWGSKTSQVVYMTIMFKDCTAFDQPLFEWDVSNVKEMRQMFYNCTSFIQDLSMWIIFPDTDIGQMFDNCPITNRPNVTQLNNRYTEQRQHALLNAESVLQPLRQQNAQRIAMHDERQRLREQYREERERRWQPIADRDFIQRGQTQGQINQQQQVAQQEINQNVQTQGQINRQQQVAQQEEINRNVRENVVPEEISEFPDCLVCGEFLDNQPKIRETPYNYCSDKCFDAIQICKNNHILHRGCILDWCNVSGVDVGSQMGSIYSSIKEQSRKNKCPFCQEPLIMPCNDFKNASSLSIDELKEYNKLKSGGKKRKTRKQRKKQRRKTRKQRRKTKKLGKKRK